MAKGPSYLARLLEACREHGEQSEPNHEVGDLQGIVRDLWAILTPQQQRRYAAQNRELIDTWLGDQEVKGRQ